MKSILSIVPKELETIAWLIINQQLTAFDTKKILLTPCRENNIISIIPIEKFLDFGSYNIGEEIYQLDTKNIFMNRNDVKILIGILTEQELEWYKNGLLKYNYSYSECIELTYEDIPEIYKIL